MVEDSLYFSITFMLYKRKGLFLWDTDYFIIHILFLVSDNQQSLLVELHCHHEVFVIDFPDPDHFNIAGEPVAISGASFGVIEVLGTRTGSLFALPKRCLENERIESYVLDDLFLLFPLFFELLVIVVRFFLLQSLQHPCIFYLDCLQLASSKTCVEAAVHPVFILVSLRLFIHCSCNFFQQIAVLSLNLCKFVFLNPQLLILVESGGHPVGITTDGTHLFQTLQVSIDLLFYFPSLHALFATPKSCSHRQFYQQLSELYQAYHSCSLPMDDIIPDIVPVFGVVPLQNFRRVHQFLQNAFIFGDILLSVDESHQKGDVSVAVVTLLRPSRIVCQQIFCIFG